MLSKDSWIRYLVVPDKLMRGDKTLGDLGCCDPVECRRGGLCAQATGFRRYLTREGVTEEELAAKAEEAAELCPVVFGGAVEKAREIQRQVELALRGNGKVGDEERKALAVLLLGTADKRNGDGEERYAGLLRQAAGDIDPEYVGRRGYKWL